MLCGADGAGAGLRIARYKVDKAEPEVAESPQVADVIVVLQRASAALDVLEAEAKSNKGGAEGGTTLGEAVARVLERDCKAAAGLIDALLPKSDTFDVLVGAHPLPMLQAWVFAWRLLSVYGGDMRLKL
jgi:hypothetical protein